MQIKKSRPDVGTLRATYGYLITEQPLNELTSILYQITFTLYT